MTKPERKIVVELVESDKAADLRLIALAIAEKIKREGMNANDRRTKVH